MMAETIGRNVHVNSWLLFNGDDGSEPSVEDTYKLCDELTKSGPRMRCHIANVTNCPTGEPPSMCFDAPAHSACQLKPCRR